MNDHTLAVWVLVNLYIFVCPVIAGLFVPGNKGFKHDYKVGFAVLHSLTIMVACIVSVVSLFWWAIDVLKGGAA